VGSANALSIRTGAEEVAAVIHPGMEIRVLQQAVPGATIHRYVPDVHAAERELGLSEGVSLSDAIQRTAAWHEIASLGENNSD
jgi:nucleoside-diphosphate-sugar epimerase